MGSRGAAGWGWDSALPYFRKWSVTWISMAPGDGPLHGKDGRIPIRRIPRDHWCPHACATAAAFEQAGSRFLPDQNGVWQDGYFPVTISNQNEQRPPPRPATWTEPRGRGRTWTINTDTTVRALLFDGSVCVGIRATVGGRRSSIAGGR